jgi:hypothetical protein
LIPGGVGGRRVRWTILYNVHFTRIFRERPAHHTTIEVGLLNKNIFPTYPAFHRNTKGPSRIPVKTRYQNQIFDFTWQNREAAFPTSNFLSAFTYSFPLLARRKSACHIPFPARTFLK